MLMLQKFLNTRVISDLRNDPFNMHIQTKEFSENKLVLVKYNQIKSNFSHKLVRESRGIILEHNTWKVVCHPFHKFFNLGETYGFNHIELNESLIFEKADGCLDADTIIITEDGEKTIKWICDNKYFGKVLSYDIDNDIEIWDKILEHSIQDNNNDWYEIELMDGKNIKLTGNHRVWLPKFHCYRRVDELQGDEEFLLRKP